MEETHCPTDLHSTGRICLFTDVEVWSDRIRAFSAHGYNVPHISLHTRSNFRHLSHNPCTSPKYYLDDSTYTSSIGQRKSNGSVGHRSHFQESLIKVFSGGDMDPATHTRTLTECAPNQHLTIQSTGTTIRRRDNRSHNDASCLGYANNTTDPFVQSTGLSCFFACCRFIAVSSTQRILRTSQTCLRDCQGQGSLE